MACRIRVPVNHCCGVDDFAHRAVGQLLREGGLPVGDRINVRKPHGD